LTRRALVIGSTGHIGQAITRELLARGYAVSATTRARSPRGLADLDVELLRGDADSPGQLAAWTAGHDVVIDAAAPYPVNMFLPSGPAGRTHVARAKRRAVDLVEATEASGSTLGYVSSFTTLERPDPPGSLAAIEASMRRQVHPYFAVKDAMEEVVLAGARRGVPAAIVNPATCMGPWDRRAKDAFVPQLLSGVVPATVTRPVNVIDVRDVATALCTAIEAEHFGEPIPLCGHNIAVDDLAARVCSLGGVPAPVFRTSARLAAATTLWAEAAWAITGRPAPIPALWTLLILEGYEMSPSRAQRELGLVPRPLDETIRDSIAWYRATGAC